MFYLSYQHLAIAIVLTLIFVWGSLRWYHDKNVQILPGPRGWPLIGHLPVFLSSNPTDYLAECSRKFGDIFKLQLGHQQIFVVSTIDLVREVFNNGNVQNRTPNASLYKVLGRNAHGITFASNSPWREGRKFILRLFRNLGMGRESFESKIIAEVRRLVMKIDEKVGERENNIKGKFLLATSNITCGIVFGKQYEYNDPSLKLMIDFVKTLFNTAGPAGVFATNRLLCALPFGPGSKVVSCLRKFKPKMEQIINNRISSFDPKQPPSNVLDAFLQELRRGSENLVHMNFENLHACWIDLFVAGTDTTASTLSFAILFLATHLDVQEKCQRELDLFVKEGGQLTYSERSKLPFLQAVIHETQRMSNVAPLGLPHLTDRNIILAGYDLPKGSSIVCNMKVLFMNDKVFEHPEEFDPHRFIRDGAFEESPQVIPFSVGNRACLGERLARMELFIFLSHLLYRYSFKPPKDDAMPKILDGIETADTRSPLPYEVVIWERIPQMS